MATTKTPLTFYNYDKLYSYNGVYNFLLGVRGVGKTYGIIKKCIEKFIRTGEQFIYLRRYKPELINKDTFFAALEKENAFPDYDFKVSGRHGFISHIKYRDGDPKDRPWDLIVYFVSLSTAQSLKGVSYPLVKTIIFDEFIIEKGHTQYLPSEAATMQNFYSTVDRNQDRTRVFFLANAVSMHNPYFLEYHIEPKKGKEFISLFDGFIVCHFPNSKDFQTGVYKTRFGKFIEGTEYADYAVGNEFSDNHDSMLAEKPSTMRYMFTLESKTGVFSVWYSDMFYHFQENRPKQELYFTLEPSKMKEGKVLLENNDKIIQRLRTAYRLERATFDKARTRNIFLQVFRR